MKVPFHIRHKLRFALFPTIAFLFALPVWAQEKSTAAPRSSVSPINEVRALWVVRTTLTSPTKIQAMVKAAQENGFNTIQREEILELVREYQTADRVMKKAHDYAAMAKDYLLLTVCDKRDDRFGQ